MPRIKKRLIKVLPFPGLRQETTYQLQVAEAREGVNPSELSVTFKFTGPEQLGRTHKATLPPLRPEGLTAELMAACGFDVALGSVDLDAMVDVTVGAKFKTDGNGQYSIVAFIPVGTEKNHEPAGTTQLVSNEASDAKAPIAQRQDL